MNPIKPKALKPGDTIGVVVPAGPVDRERIDRALARVRTRGFEIKTYGDIYRADGYLAGDDATRAAELMAAFEDPETAAVWCARGGYGVVRLLERIDFNVIRRHPKVFIGFSDISALHVAIQKRVGLITFHGPNLQDGFGKPDDIPPSNEAALWQAVMGDQDAAPNTGYDFDLDAYRSEMRPLYPGVAVGRLTGGNLSVLCGLMGTPFEIELAGRILFLEDLNEAPYRVDRYLSQLALAGKLQTAIGVLLGSFSYDEGEPSDAKSSLAELLEHYFGRVKKPVLAGFPAGHEAANYTLPIGAVVEMDSLSGNVRLRESPVLLARSS